MLCILDSIAHELRQEIHNHYEKTFGNRPLKVKITSEKESEKFTAIKAV